MGRPQRLTGWAGLRGLWAILRGLQTWPCSQAFEPVSEAYTSGWAQRLLGRADRLIARLRGLQTGPGSEA